MLLHKHVEWVQPRAVYAGYLAPTERKIPEPVPTEQAGAVATDDNENELLALFAVLHLDIQRADDRHTFVRVSLEDQVRRVQLEDNSARWVVSEMIETAAPVSTSMVNLVPLAKTSTSIGHDGRVVNWWRRYTPHRYCLLRFLPPVHGVYGSYGFSGNGDPMQGAVNAEVDSSICKQERYGPFCGSDNIPRP